MRVVCTRDCPVPSRSMVDTTNKNLFTKGKVYTFLKNGSLEDDLGFYISFHINSSGKTPLEKWNNYYGILAGGQAHRLHKLFVPLENSIKRF